MQLELSPRQQETIANALTILAAAIIIACNTLTRIGKNTIRIVTKSFGQKVNPNHMMKSGAKATFGAI